MEELRCRFLGVVEGDETVEEVAAVAGGDGLAGGASNGSGGGPFFGSGFNVVMVGGGMGF